MCIILWLISIIFHTCVEYYTRTGMLVLLKQEYDTLLTFHDTGGLSIFEEFYNETSTECAQYCESFVKE